MRIIYTVLAISIVISTAAQQDPQNLRFDNTSGHLNPWTATRFSAKKYFISHDSVIKHSGHGSVQFTYEPSNSESTDGCLFQVFPVDVIGKKLVFSFWAKQSNPADTAGLVSLILSVNKVEKKFAVGGYAIIHAGEWTKFTREFDLDTLPQPLHHARVNILAKSKDAFWVDDITIEIDGKNIYDQPSYSSPAGEQPVAYSALQVENLEVLCKTWGFLKYYHPLVAEGKFNWDMELFRMIPLVELAKDRATCDEILSNWIRSLGNIPPCKNCSEHLPAQSYTVNIDLGWMRSGELSYDLQQLLASIFQNRHQGDGYYARYEPVKNLGFNDNENEYNWRDKVYPSRKFRLQFLFRYWNTIQYFSPYKNLIGKNWNTVLHEFIPVIGAVKDSIEYHVAMAKIVNSVHDSHTGNYDPVLAGAFAKLYLPVMTKVINDQAVVTGFYNDSLAKQHGFKKGDVIESVDGKTVKQIIDDRIEMANGSNYPTKLRTLAAWNFITGGKDSLVELEILRDGKRFSSVVHRYPFSTFHYKSVKDSSKFRIIDNNIAYVNMGMLQKEEVEFVMEQLENTRGIIFDIRNYPNGTLYHLLGYLLEQPAEFAKVIYPDLNYPGNFLWSKAKISAGPAESMTNIYHYKGKVVLLVNETTQSHAEWTTMALQTVPGAITIGSQTSGADGNASSLYLTGNYFSYLTGLGVFYPDGTATQRTGVKIDIEVKPTVEGIKNNRDELLEKAITVINQ